MPVSVLQTRTANKSDFPFAMLKFGLMVEQRSLLHERIAARFDIMLAAGLTDELNGLRKRYALDAQMPSMRCVGYRQAWQFLDGNIDARQLREQGVAATRQLAKRQITWLQAMQDLERLDCLQSDLQRAVATRVTEFLQTV
jgi:tRNA dimethylallyltransferase